MDFMKTKETVTKSDWLGADVPDDEPHPPQLGWYPILHEWEAPEGYFPEGGYWNGERFVIKPGSELDWGSTIWLPVFCDTKEEAELLAKKFDLEI